MNTNFFAFTDGFRYLGMGMDLVKKPNKSEEELEAANSFKKWMKAIFTLIGIAVVLLGGSVVYMTIVFAKTDGIERNGTVEGDSVRYFHNEEVHVSLSEIGINPSEVNEGDRIILLFDYRTDTFQEAILRDTYDKETNMVVYVIVGSLIFSVVMLVGGSRILERKVAKPFRAWCAKQIEEQEKLAR
jgi:hypothetical protein